VRAGRVDTEIVGEFASRVLAVSLIVYSDCVERETVTDGRLRRKVMQLTQIDQVKLEPVSSSLGLTNLIIRGRDDRVLRIEMMDAASAAEAAGLVERLRASGGPV
jgi:hypothetical protein